VFKYGYGRSNAPACWPIGATWSRDAEGFLKVRAARRATSSGRVRLLHMRQRPVKGQASAFAPNWQCLDLHLALEGYCAVLVTFGGPRNGGWSSCGDWE